MFSKTLNVSGICRNLHLTGHRVPMRLSCAKLTRFYTVKPPVYKKTGNILVNAMNYVKDVEDYQMELSTMSPDKKLANELLTKIAHQPELLFLLSLFHTELAKIGITPSTTDAAVSSKVWRYRALYIMRLSRIHNIFWSQCQYLDISERDHKLGFSPTQIGILDPRNFDQSTYEELQHGSYEGTSFKDISILGVGKYN